MIILSGNFIFRDHSREIMQHFENQLYKGLEEIGLRAVGYASDLTPVDTGRLKNSMAFTTKFVKGKTLRITPENGGGGVRQERDVVSTDEDFMVFIGTNVYYSPYIEYGTGIYASNGNGRPDAWSWQDPEGNWHRTRGVKPQHMLKNAVSNHIEEYNEVLKKALKGE